MYKSKFTMCMCDACCVLDVVFHSCGNFGPICLEKCRPLVDGLSAVWASIFQQNKTLKAMFLTALLKPLDEGCTLAAGLAAKVRGRRSSPLLSLSWLVMTGSDKELCVGL